MCIFVIFISSDYYPHVYPNILDHVPCSVLQGDWTLEYVKLKAKIELLQKNHRQYMGEDLDSMNLRDLQNLEQQLDTSLKHIRTRKVY